MRLTGRRDGAFTVMAMPCQQIAHGLDQLVFRHRELRLRLLLPILVAVGREAGDLGAERPGP